MPRFRLNVAITHKGAIFDANVRKSAAARMVIGMNEVLAQAALGAIIQRLGTVLRNPTGYYESRIAVERRAIYRGVTDSGVVYGGWLEGVDPRNRTTRFKGYGTFAYARQIIERDKFALVDPIVKRYVGEMN